MIDKEVMIMINSKEAANIYLRNSGASSVLLKGRVPCNAATHILYRSDFRDETMFDYILEAHGIDDVDDVDSITIRSTVECVEGE